MFRNTFVLQEFILLKLKRKVGPEYEDQRLLQKELAVGVDEAVLKATISSSDVSVFLQFCNSKNNLYFVAYVC